MNKSDGKFWINDIRDFRNAVIKNSEPIDNFLEYLKTLTTYPYARRTIRAELDFLIVTYSAMKAKSFTVCVDDAISQDTFKPECSANVATYKTNIRNDANCVLNVGAVGEEITLRYIVRRFLTRPKKHIDDVILKNDDKNGNFRISSSTNDYLTKAVHDESCLKSPQSCKTYIWLMVKEKLERFKDRYRRYHNKYALNIFA